MTCCYCGTRAALVLDRGRHELACSACGAPLHDMKMLRQDKTETARRDPAAMRPRPDVPPARPARYKPRPARRRKGLFRKVFEEVFDAIEDIFD